MHRHLSRKERNATLFLIQYARHVVFLGGNDHAAFRDDPPGSVLYRLHRNAILRFETGLDAEAADSVALRRAAVSAGIKPRKPAGPRAD